MSSKGEIDIPALSRKDIAVHIVGVIWNVSFTLWGIVWLFMERGALSPAWYIWAIVVVIGLFLADFFSGLLHWTFDTWFTERSPYVRRMVLIVREHHVYPQHIFRYKFAYEAGSVSLASLVHTVPIIGFVTLVTNNPTTIGYCAVAVSVIVSVITLFMLQFHKLGHRITTSPLLVALQKSHLLMSVSHHARHHRANHDTKYCLINGWANLVCDRIGFWRWVERAIQRITGAAPRSDDNDWMRSYGRRHSESFAAPDVPNRGIVK